VRRLVPTLTRFDSVCCFARYFVETLLPQASHPDPWGHPEGTRSLSDGHGIGEAATRADLQPERTIRRVMLLFLLGTEQGGADHGIQTAVKPPTRSKEVARRILVSEAQSRSTYPDPNAPHGKHTPCPERPTSACQNQCAVRFGLVWSWRS
jgi:hypothetical protein